MRVTGPFDASGAPVEIELTAKAATSRSFDTDAVPAPRHDTCPTPMADTLPDTGSGILAAASRSRGRMSRIVIEQWPGRAPNNSGVNVTDVFFDAPLVADPEGPGNDTLDGGVGG